MTKAITIMLILLLLPGIAAGLENGSCGDPYIQVTHTIDDRVGECSEGSVIFFGEVRSCGNLVPHTPVTIHVSEPWSLELHTETDDTGHYSIEYTIEECCEPGEMTVVGEADDIGVYDDTLLLIAPPDPSWVIV